MANRQSIATPITPPMTPAKHKQHQAVEKGPFIMTSTPEGMTPLQRHCAFFDRNGDGILTPWDTFASFRDLGYNLLMSIWGTAIVHLFLSYPTLDTWIPDPFFSIHLNNIHRCIHGSDSGAYNNFGHLSTAPVDNFMALFDVESKSGLNFWQGWRMMKAQRDLNDPFGWLAAFFEWGFLWVLCADRGGVVSFEAIRGQYDGTLFYAIRDQRRAQGHTKQQ